MRGRTRLALGVVLAACVNGLAPGAESAYTISASTFLGGSGDEDSVVGVRIQKDGTLVVAANLAADFGRQMKIERRGGPEAQAGAVLRLSSDGQKVLSLLRVAPQVKDLALDANDNIYVAAATGALKLPPEADRVLWTKAFAGGCERLDAGTDGHSAALTGDKRVCVLTPDGQRELGSIPASGFTGDVCVDSATQTVIVVGFRNARAHDGNRVEPVQISYVHAHGYDGKQKWFAYDWSTEQRSERFINRSGNNMADSRAYRCTVGRDGKLYVAFEAAGGNHIFRYSPVNIMEKAPLVGGGAYHEFYGGGGAAHRTIFGRFDPATGKVDRVQQFTGRTEQGRCTNVRMKEGNLTADEDGRPFLAGLGACLPLNLDPCAAGEPKDGPYLLGMTPDFRQRLVCTRMQEKGSAHCVDARRVGDVELAVYGGGAAEKGMFVQNAIQPEANGKDGFLVILQSPVGTPGADPVKPDEKKLDTQPAK